MKRLAVIQNTYIRFDLFFGGDKKCGWYNLFWILCIRYRSTAADRKSKIRRSVVATRIRLCLGSFRNSVIASLRVRTNPLEPLRSRWDPSVWLRTLSLRILSNLATAKTSVAGGFSDPGDSLPLTSDSEESCSCNCVHTL